ncbi:MAG: TonB-denpendent receptor [Bacteroidetes bacterium OLB11]|nr:MAG: TonB-denpendent receptor [Bacteroidetes bacterium OLB11]
MICLCVFSFNVNHAQQLSNELAELGNVTITANLSEQKMKETGRNLVVLKGDFFYKLPVHSLDELLKYIPGIEVQQRGALGAQSDIVIRGGTFQQVLVIIDGVKLNDPLTGHFNATIPIHPAEIERIEVLKGASSAIYGSEAVGGVINIITKTFSQKMNKGNDAKLDLSAGQYNTYSGSVFLKTSSEKNVLTGSFMSNHTNGNELRGTNGFAHLNIGNISYAHSFNHNWRLNARVAADFRDFNAQNFYTTFLSDTANEKVNTFWSQVSLIKKMENGLWQTDAAFKMLHDQYWYNPSSKPNDNRSKLFFIQSHYTENIDENNAFTGGLQFSKKDIVSNDRGNHSLLHGAVFGMMKHQLLKDLFLNESLRLEADEVYGVQLLPQVNLAWSPNQMTLRTSVGKSVRDADFTERYNNYNKPNVSGGSIGNPDLNPESAWNIEIGADYRFSNAFKWNNTLFYRKQHNLIDWTQTNYIDMPRTENLVPGKVYALATNNSEVKTTGFESDIHFSKKISKDFSLFASLGYTYLNTQSEDSIISFYLSSHAKHILNIAFVGSYQKFSLSWNAVYKNREKKSESAINAYLSPSYFLMSGKIGYALPKKYGSVYLEVDNILNESYSDLLGSVMPSRMLLLGYSFKL